MLYNIENQHEIMRVPSKTSTSSFGFIPVYHDIIFCPGLLQWKLLVCLLKKKFLYNIAIDYSTKPLEMLIRQPNMSNHNSNSNHLPMMISMMARFEQLNTLLLC